MAKKTKKPKLNKPKKKPPVKAAKPAAKKALVKKTVAAKPKDSKPITKNKKMGSLITEVVKGKDKTKLKNTPPAKILAETEVVTTEIKEELGFEEVVLTDAEGRRYCRVSDCDQLAIVDIYCRYHYLLYWKKIQVRKKILTEGKLSRYIEELTSRYPDKYLDMLKKDLRSEKEFLAAIQELQLDDNAEDGEFDDETSYLDEVREISGGGGVTRDEEEF